MNSQNHPFLFGRPFQLALIAGRCGWYRELSLPYILILCRESIRNTFGRGGLGVRLLPLQIEATARSLSLAGLLLKEFRERRTCLTVMNVVYDRVLWR